MAATEVSTWEYSRIALLRNLSRGAAAMTLLVSATRSAAWRRSRSRQPVGEGRPQVVDLGVDGGPGVVHQHLALAQLGEAHAGLAGIEQVGQLGRLGGGPLGVGQHPGALGHARR